MPPTFLCREIGNAPRSMPRNRRLWFVVLGIALTCTAGHPVFLPDMLLSSKTVGFVGLWRSCRFHPESQISRLSFSACRPWPVETLKHSAPYTALFYIPHFVVECISCILSRCLFGEILTLKVCGNHLLSTRALYSARSASLRVVSIDLGRDRLPTLDEIGHLGSELLVEWVTQRCLSVL